MRLALIDGSNLYESAKALQLRLDYAKLHNLLNDDGELLRAYYFTALQDKEVYSPLRKTVDWLSHHGYNCITKPVQEFVDPITQARKIKGNVDVDLASYAFTFAKQVSEIWLFSGDGDFTVMVKMLQEHHQLKVYVVSTLGLVSTELRKQADKYIDLSELAKQMETL